MYETNSIGRAPAAITEKESGDIEGTIPGFRLTTWNAVPRIIGHGAFRRNNQTCSTEEQYSRDAKRSQKDSSARAAIVD